MKEDENLEFPWSSTIDTGNPTSVYGHEIAHCYGLDNWPKTIFQKVQSDWIHFREVFKCVLVKTNLVLSCVMCFDI